MAKNKTKCGARTSAKDKKKSGSVTRRNKKSMAIKPAGSRIFEGATEISLTENKIAVTRSISKSSKGNYSEMTVREYHDRTPENMRAFGNVTNKRGVKKITVNLK